ncbi:acyl-CoA thioesterase [Trujillonella humicola]|uniref:acyl-CoA thioesterase n=1 Tax=Trujillonella humicola TaxID=3383699 RepID=UPI003905DC40
MGDPVTAGPAVPGRDTATLREVLDLEDTADGAFVSRVHRPSGQLFGGQVAAQALAAAGRTVAPDRGVHSLHAYFLTFGDPAVPIRYRVDETRDGGAFSTRRVVAEQGAEVLFVLAASFARRVDGPAHQGPTPGPVNPDAAPDGEDLLPAGDEDSREWFARLRTLFPLDVRFPDEPVRARVLRGERPEPRQRVLVRAADPLGDDPLVHACALVYLSDLFLLSTALPPHGIAMGRPGMRIVSLDHAVWFHAPVRADDWLHYAMESPWAGDGRALSRGQLFDTGGRLLASVAQEGTLRAARR